MDVSYMLESWGCKIGRQMNRREFLSISIMPVIIPLRRRNKILLIGDSYAYAMSGELKKCVHYLDEFVSVARGGSSCKEWLKNLWLVAALRRHKPDLVLISLGINDYDRKNLFWNMKKLIELCHGYGARVIWLLPPRTTRINSGFVAEAVVIAGPDGAHNSAGLDLPLEKDGAHPTVSGMRIWAESVADYVWRD